MVLIRCDTQLTSDVLLARNVAIKQRNGPIRTARGVNRSAAPAKTRMSTPLPARGGARTVRRNRLRKRLRDRYHPASSGPNLAGAAQKSGDTPMIRPTRRLALRALAGAAALALLPQFAFAADAKPRVALVMKS